MRVIYINMHCNALIVNPLIYILQNQRLPNRHRSFVKKMIDEGVEVVNFVTLKGTTLYHRYTLVHQLMKRLSVYKKEAEYVLKKNGLESVKIVTDEDELNICDDDLIIYYEFYINSYNDYYLDRGKKIVDMTHFYGYRGGADRIKRLNPQYMMMEVNLNEYSSLFRKNYGWFSGRRIIRPFSFENRFVKKKEYSNRKNKCFISGTLANLHIDSDVHFEYMCEYNTKYMQPQRVKLYQKSREMAEYVDCVSYDFDGAVQKNYIKVTDKDGWLTREYIFWRNYLFGNKFPNYFTDFNIVEKYNEYKLSACGEDANGIYAIGALEGMACGTAFVGQDYGAYQDMGLKPDYHFISYDGSMEDFGEKVSFFLSEKQENKLETIALNGYQYVKNHFSEFEVDSLYVNEIKKIWKE